jgi:glutathionylspermidine synthase
MRTVLPAGDYVQTWDAVARAGERHLNLDARASGRRYLSLASLSLTAKEAHELALVTETFARLLDRAVDGILTDPDWWSALAWPWPAIELARQEPAHPDGLSSLFGRFDFLLEPGRGWQVIEYNADTPSGGREAAGLEPAIARLHPSLRPLRRALSRRLVQALRWRINQYPSPVRLVGVVSSHSWIEDMAQATWLAWLLQRAGQPALVGDVNDLSARSGRLYLRGRQIDALYRFYPVERLYRHSIFASLCEAVIDGRLLALNGLRGFVAQSKACLAWLWSVRAELGVHEQALVERHLPATVRARDAAAIDLLPCGVVKHVNGREGDSVVFGRTLSQSAWEARLLEGGYVVQRAVSSEAVSDVIVDADGVREVRPRYACVGGFTIGGRFGGCYTRLDGPITSAQATYAATLRER